jgi:hypothetical protein
MTGFLAPGMWPFALAAGLMLALAVAEALSMLVGASLTHWLGGFVHFGGDGASDSVLGWLHVGKVPLLVLLVAFLTVFAVTGYAVQFASAGLIGHTLPVLLAALPAFAASIAGVRLFGAGLGKLIPQDETSAAPDASLVGRAATVVIGAATRGKPTQARTRDQFGNMQYVMIEPEEADQKLEAGSSVLLVRHLGGRLFSAIPNPKPEFL